jgi:hypothetical protein
MGILQVRILKSAAPMFLLAACSSHSAADVSKSTSAASAAGVPVNRVIPMLLIKDRVIIDRAQEKISEGCMRKAGFDGYTAPAWIEPPPEGSGENIGVRLAILQEDPGERGYGLDVPPPQPPDDPYYDSLPPATQEAFNRAFNGSKSQKVVVGTVEISRPGDGCRSEAENALYPDDEYFLLNSQRSVMSVELGQNISADVRWTEVKKQWSQCMKLKGYTYEDPADALSDLEGRSYEGPRDVAPGEPPAVQKPKDKAAVRAEEIVVAKQDYACQQQVHYAAITQTVKNDAVMAVSEKSQGAFERLLELEQKALAKAKEILNQK